MHNTVEPEGCFRFDYNLPAYHNTGKGSTEKDESIKPCFGHDKKSNGKLNF